MSLRGKDARAPLFDAAMILMCMVRRPGLWTKRRGFVALGMSPRGSSWGQTRTSKPSAPQRPPLGRRPVRLVLDIRGPGERCLCQMPQMPPTNILQINFQDGGRTIPVTVKLEVPENPPLEEMLDVENLEYIQWFELRDYGVVDGESLTKFLSSISAGSERLYVWCYDIPWRKLLALIGVDYPFPAEPIAWPPPSKNE
jgi:hypothetical protein